MFGWGLKFAAQTIGVSFDIASTNPSAYYDRTVLATLFQNSAGTTPVTAGSQPVGLVLDKSQGLVLGPELNVNPAAWTPQAGWSNDGGGEYTCSSGTNSIFVVGVTGGAKLYEYSLRISNYVSGSVFFDQGASSTTMSGNGVHKGYFQSPDGVDAYLYLSALFGFLGTVGDIKIKRVAGNHQSQADAGKRPITDGTPIYANFDGVDDDLVTTFPASLGAGCTVCRSLPATGADITTGVTLTATYTDTVDAHALLIYTAAQWAALDAGQIANITTWLNGRAGL